MFEVKIYSLSNDVLQAVQQFSTLEEALQWIKQGNELGWWQTDPIKEEQINEAESDLSSGNNEQSVIRPATHRYEITNITDRVQEQQIIEQCVQNKQLGMYILESINVEFIKYQFDVNKLYDILLDPDYIFIGRLLQLGYLRYAREFLQNKESKLVQLLGYDLYQWLKEQICMACNKK